MCPSCGYDRSGGPQPFEKGTVLEGRYRIDVEVGRGGMGVVYRGTDLTLSRPVAIKAMRVSGAGAGVLARFMHEARALASVEHPNLVPAYAIGQEAGVYYMVMKFVEGRPLSDVLKFEGAQSEQSVRALIVEVCAALKALHASGLVHRDLKPANLMIGDDGRVTVMDLGIVQQIGDDADGVAAASTVGTPRYMPPEMFSGGEVDGRADIYALGVIAWHALVGRPPFDGPTPMAILYKQAHEAPPSLTEAAPHVSKRLVAAIERALAKDPNQRWIDAETFAAVLDAPEVGAETSGRGRTVGLIIALLAVVGLSAGAVKLIFGEADPPAAVIVDQGLPPPVDAAVPDAAVPDAAVPDAAVPDAAVPEKVTIKVTSKPSGASVRAGGKSLGRTPLTFEWEKGEDRLRIRVRKKGYRAKSTRVGVSADGSAHVELEPEFELVP